jgi:hypothetical protein
MIVNVPTAASDTIAVTGNATFKVRPYQAGTTGVNAYRNLLIWQLAADQSGPLPFPQPMVNLQGGGSVDMTGGVYVPAATVSMGGGAGGVGGNLTIQFIAWKLWLQGNVNFHFIYKADAFPRPYGLRPGAMASLSRR